MLDPAQANKPTRAQRENAMKAPATTLARCSNRISAYCFALLVCPGLPMAAGGPPKAQTHAQARVIVTQAQAGLLGPPAAALSQFVPSTMLSLHDGQQFGWRMKLQTQLATVRVREELTLPTEPRTWGDPEPDLKRKTSADGRTATTELLLVPVDGVIQFSWTVTRGDPAGTWVLKVQVEDLPVQTFRLQAK